MKISNSLKLIISLIIPQLAGAIGSIFTISAIPTWYATLERPLLAPPNWIFGPVWTTLFILMGIALFLVWRNSDSKNGKGAAIAVFAIQLVLNTFWSIIFFRLQSPMWAFFEVIILWVAILITMIKFYNINRISAYLLVPYIAWVSFAAYLNFMIWRLN